MAFKTSRKTYRSKGSRPWYRKKYSVMDLAGKAWQGVKYLKGIINSEKNLYDKNNTGTFDYNGTVIPLTDIPQGDGIGSRSGNSILAKSLHLRLQMIGSSLVSSTVVRVMVVMDTMNLGSVPNVSDILMNSGSSQVTNANLTVVTSYQTRFRILVDRITYLSNAGQNVKNANIFKRLNTHIKYTGATGTDEGRNQLYLLICSNQNVNNPIVDYNSRFQYYDN